MQIRGVKAPVSRPDRNRETTRPGHPAVAHRAGDRGHSRRADRPSDVDAPVLARGIGVVAVAVLGDHLTLDRPRPQLGPAGVYGTEQQGCRDHQREC